VAAILQAIGLQKVYNPENPTRTVALDGLSFCVDQGEFVSFVGPSGCGKTTLLMTLSCLTEPTGGKILVKDREVAAPPPEMAVVFQDYGRSLFPWRTVLRNVTFGLESKKQLSTADRTEIAMRAIRDVGLAGFEQHYPWQLSGGMQQRVAIARALAYEPDILLMDEPFASVDAQARTELEDLLLGIWEKFSQTILFVTHDIEEAVYLSDRVFVLSARPASIINAMSVDLGRPRDQLATRELPAFWKYRHEIYRIIRQETIRQRADATGAPPGEVRP